MEEQESKPDSSPKPRSSSRSRRYIFAIVLIAACVLVYLNQRREPRLERDWPEGLSETLQQAAQEDRRVLAFFVAHPPGEATRRLVRTTLAKRKNRDAITEGNFIRVRQRLDESLDSELAKKYRITRLPTMLILAPDGAELNRREGFIGEVEFRTEFLTGEAVRKPGEGQE